MNTWRRSAFALGVGLVCSGWVLAQVSVSVPGQEVRVGKGSGNHASVTVGKIAEDANIEGVTIINDRVSIDGKDIPPNTTRYKSPKTGKVYLIERNKSGVSVSETGGTK